MRRAGLRSGNASPNCRRLPPRLLASLCRAIGGGYRGLLIDLPDNSVSDISMRSTGFHPGVWDEILRVAMPGCVITVSGPRDYWLGYYRDLRNLKIISGYERLSNPLPVVLPVRTPDGRWSPSPLPNIIFTIRLGGNETLL